MSKIWIRTEHAELYIDPRDITIYISLEHDNEHAVIVNGCTRVSITKEQAMYIVEKLGGDLPPWRKKEHE